MGLRRGSVLVGVVLALGSSGCGKLGKKSNGTAGTLTTPPTPVWKDGEVTFSDLAAKGRFFVNGTKLDVTFQDLPTGTGVTSGAERATADASGRAAVRVDLKGRVAKLSPRDAFDYKFKLDPQTKVDLDFGNGIKLTLDAPRATVSYGLSDTFKKSLDAPIDLPPPAVAPSEHTVLFMGGSSAEAIGPAATVDAIDWVALVTNLPERAGKTCNGYKKDGSKERSFVLQMVDQRVAVIDARSSRSIASKDFKAKDDCPLMAFGGAAKTYASSDDEKAWLRELRTSK